MNSFQTLTKRLCDEPKAWLVTGVGGFIGSNVMEALLKLDQRVTGLDNYSTGHRGNLNEVRKLVTASQWERLSLIEGDIRDLETCETACEGIDYVLHQAALGSVPVSLTNPLEANANNVSGFLNILVAAKKHSIKRFVYASSCAVYGDDPELPKVEEMIGNCLSPYALTKRVNELYSEVFSRCYDFESIGLRYFNIFGERQDPDGPYAAVIPKWIAAMINNEPIEINGDGQTSRDFCYVANVVEANILAATTQNHRASKHVYNVGLGKRTSLNSLFEMLRSRLLPFHPHLKSCTPVYRDFRKGDVRHSEADIRKAREELGYEPSHQMEDGLDAALPWYQKTLGPK